MGLNSFLSSAVRVLKKKKVIAIPQYVDQASLLRGKNVLITGGSGGIGMAIAKSFVGSGAKVVIGGTNPEKLRKCCGSIEGLLGLIIDVSKPDELSKKIEEGEVLLGDDAHFDILVNSAGIINHSTFFDMGEAEFDKIMDINSKGTFFMCQAFAHYLITHKKKGHILNVSSSSALRPAWTAYEMSKWTIRGFTEGLADILLPYGIIVNAIGPGPTATPMLGKGKKDDDIGRNGLSERYVTPEEIANLALFMVSPMGDMIVGETYYLTGGSGRISLHQ